MNHFEIFSKYIDYCLLEEVDYSEIPEIKNSKEWKSIYMKEINFHLGLFYHQNDDLLGYFDPNKEIMYINKCKLKSVPIKIINDLIEMSINFFSEENVVIVENNTEEFNLLISKL